jgi:hypothetical protein
MQEIMEHNRLAMIIDGHDNAIVGMVRQHGSDPIVIYDPNIIIDNLMMNDDMDYDDAVEWFQMNIECAYVGKSTPAMLIRLNTKGRDDEAGMEEDDS